MKLGRPPKMTPHQMKEAPKRRDAGRADGRHRAQLQRLARHDFTACAIGGDIAAVLVHTRVRVAKLKGYHGWRPPCFERCQWPVGASRADSHSGVRSLTVCGMSCICSTRLIIMVALVWITGDVSETSHMLAPTTARTLPHTRRSGRPAKAPIVSARMRAHRRQWRGQIPRDGLAPPR